MTQGSARTTATSETTTGSFKLSAQAGESYTLEVYYDRVFGSFALRRPLPVLVKPISA